MTKLTYASQIRTAVITDRVARFRVVMSITDKGDLPDKSVFLKAITAVADPKQDDLVRVARTGDMLAYTNSREEAIRRRDPYWRDAVVIKDYNDIEAARIASGFLKEQVNALVREYSTYTNDFVADHGEVTVFPQDDIGVIGPLIEDYVEKVRQREAQVRAVADIDARALETDTAHAETVLESAKASEILDALRTTRTTLQTMRATLSEHLSASQAVSVEIQAALSSWDGTRSGAAQAIRDAMDPTLQDPTGSLYQAYHHDFKAKVGALGQKIADLDSQIAKITAEVVAQQSRLSSLEAKKSNLLAKKETYAAEKVAARARLNELKRVEADLLAQAQALCPSYTGGV